MRKYGYDRQRVFMEEHVGNKVRTKRYVGNCEYVAYGLKDNLGSWTTITDENGEVQQRLNYDAWGNLRNPSTWANYTVNDTYEKPLFDRGYTGHEHLSAFGLINMNGRMYDPVMSSFLSADRYVQDPTSAQGFNRYAYCMYNPLRFVDPTGWAPRPGGGGNGPDIPPPYVVIDGWASGYKLDEVTITAAPLFNYEFVYTPYYNSGGGGDLQLGLGDNSQPKGHISGGGGGNHGMSNSLDGQGLLLNLSPIFSIEGTIIGYKQRQWQHPTSRIQKEYIQKEAYEIQKSLKEKGISKHVKDIKTRKIANLKFINKGIAAIGIGLEVYDVINNKEITASNLLNTSITILSFCCWPIGGLYVVTDIGVLLLTGQSIGEHFDGWVGHPVVDFKKP